TIYTFLYPLTSLHPDARSKAHAIWCAQDRSATWHDWMILGQAIPAPLEDCKLDPVADLLALGERLRIVSTPVLFLENGHRISGTRPAAQLDSLLGTAHTDRAVAAAKSPERAKS